MLFILFILYHDSVVKQYQVDVARCDKNKLMYEKIATRNSDEVEFGIMM